MVKIAKCFAGKGIKNFIFLANSKIVSAHLVRCGPGRLGFGGRDQGVNSLFYFICTADLSYFIIPN